MPATETQTDPRLRRFDLEPPEIATGTKPPENSNNSGGGGGGGCLGCLIIIVVTALIFGAIFAWKVWEIHHGQI